MSDNKRTIEEQFMAWLAQNATASRLSELYLCYPEIEKHCLRIKVLKKPLFETTDLDTIKKVHKTISESRMFQLAHKKHMKRMVSAAQYYMAFIKEYSVKFVEPVQSEPAESAAVEELLKAKNIKQNKTIQNYYLNALKASEAPQPVPMPEVQALALEDASTNAEADYFDGLLADERFSDLRSALLSEGISSVEALKTINLWSFMNIHNLYAIHQRLSISTKLTELLRNIEKHTVGSATIYEIHYNNAIYSGDTPSKAFVSFLTKIAAKYPLKFRNLISAIHPPTSKVVIYRYGYAGSKLKLLNPEAFIESDLTREQIELYVAWILERCVASPLEFRIEEVEQIIEDLPAEAPQEETPAQEAEQPEMPEEETEEDTEPEGADEEEDIDEDVLEDTEELEYIPKAFPSPAPVPTQIAEKYLLERELAGGTYDELQTYLRYTMIGTKDAVAMSPHIVEMNHRLYHDEVFVDFEEGADAIEDILDKLLKKNNGIATATQLWEYARSEMSMFLNDNDITEQQAMYDLARHLFEKLEYHGKRYFFRSNIYISLPEVSADSNNGIMQKYAREKGTTVTFKEMESYLKGLGLNSGNLRGVMRIDKEPIFLIYQENEYLLAELIHMDDAFFCQVEMALKHLFLDVGDHIILRHISDSWYNLLPTLPASLEWTPMLLQQLLHFYSGKLGARTIHAMDSQSSNTLHAMLVDNDSWIQDFQDAVAIYIHDELPERKSFEAEELRRLLVEAGMVSGNELIWHMHKALGGDPRFLWDGDGNKVTVRI